MPRKAYVVVGGGMTAAAAVQGIRDVDADGPIDVFGSEPHPPYNRPPLTKGLWKGKPLDSVWRAENRLSVTFHSGRTVTRLDADEHAVTDDRGTVYRYDRLLLATGGTPRRLPFGDNRIIYYRSLDDYERLRAATQRGRRFAVIGGGFIGSEIAAALAMNRMEVTLIFNAPAICGHLFPADLAAFLNDYYRQKGVAVNAGRTAAAITARGDESVLAIHDPKSGRDTEIAVDGIVAGVGIRPNVELAEAAGLKVDDGILVDSSLCTSLPDIYAAGDVANFYNPALGRRMRVEHEDNANTMGRTAGRAMAGESVSYDHLPFFYSDLFELGYEAVGLLDSRLETFADWKEPFRKGVVYYLQDGRVRGVLLWNVWEQVDAARKLIAEPGPFQGPDLKGRLG